MIHITLKFLGPFRSLAAEAGTDDAGKIAFKPGVRLTDALLSAPLPKDVPRVVLLNGVQHDDDPQLRDGDVIVVFPPIAGGCPEITCRS